MLRAGYYFTITCFCQNKEDVIDMVEEQLSNVLNAIHIMCEERGEEWQIECNQKCKSTSKDRNSPFQNAKLQWEFIASENTIRTIIDNFDNEDKDNLFGFFFSISDM